MTQTSKVNLKYSCIMNIPLQLYGDDFVFIVNNKEFKTNKLIADILSPKISNIHLMDPTFDKYYINTTYEGDFSHILNLINFNQNDYPEQEIPFLAEIMNDLQNYSLEIHDSEEFIEITQDKVINLVKKHKKYSIFFSNRLSIELEFISKHFNEIFDKNQEEILQFDIDTLYQIFNNDQLKLKEEDQLLRIISTLYSKDKNYSILYETVIFMNVTSLCISEFVDLFDLTDLTTSTWQKITERLKQTITVPIEKQDNKRYGYIKINFSEEKPFSGIIDYLQKRKNINDEIEFTSSSIYRNNEDNFHPRNVAKFDDETRGFGSNNEENSWICIDFKENRIIPTHYSIKSIGSYYTSAQFPKSWVIEISSDNKTWEIIDNVYNCKELNGNLFHHSFKIEKNITKKARYIKLTLKSSWYNDNYLGIDSFEVFGELKLKEDKL